ncbi:hypothetical protein GWI33_016850 [Rhynchophorus ferrugineus]|uniref:Uncharacterized protein n=1 Tax=Rhynchophorus ferrugineus TaxID=354439 RepID=A0A834I2X0_RHYFE|nr:hypothetical protein GWI33_016850 [Rhynchophorus ferrugineus]
MAIIPDDAGVQWRPVASRYTPSAVTPTKTTLLSRQGQQEKDKADLTPPSRGDSREREMRAAKRPVAP